MLSYMELIDRHEIKGMLLICYCMGNICNWERFGNGLPSGHWLKQLINIQFGGYIFQNGAENYTRLGTGAPASNYFMVSVFGWSDPSHQVRDKLGASRDTAVSSFYFYLHVILP